ncbi:similar to Saccharomyces cerevisiae YPL161C BEM4 Protein involved in establishment of cell polarity and bud emergence [Maudiozyma saulgeensis]|uniref:Similar to Saccharomyces cerevisiae YPL161C BEM4 Protein involved in establishment of cell polarity and bud emergence n=1 Tax=Maudiozyma saulgeensis TaxID=1789683 RepID=A0A1X7R4J5_9SACH|nr:similar to Saccharomyces cerevisiae YPL161C BEM4 Protein involved in establishment of cell polarity and bud emergence [Kazachstania saulgeensis]
MNYEDILFGLQPLLNAQSITDVPLQTVYLDSYLTVLDQLAVSLRSPSNRDIVGQTGLLSNLLRVLSVILDMGFKEETLNNNKIAYFKLANELIRCIANALVDNDANREIFIGKPTESDLSKRNVMIDYYVGRILSLMDLPNGAEEELLSSLQTKTIILIRNLCLDNEAYYKRVATYVRGPLFTLLKNSRHVFLDDIETVVLSSELLEELIEVYSDGFTIEDILFFAQTVSLVANTVPDDIVISQEKDHENEIEEDPNVELLYNIVQSLEVIVTKNDQDDIKYKGLDDTVSLTQNALLQALNKLGKKEFQNKMITMRRLVSIVGFISANEGVSNKNDRNMCINIIKDPANGYSLAASFVILSNSINSRSDVDELLERLNIESIIESTTGKLTDPMQFSGFLDLLRKLLNTSNAMCLSVDTLSKLIITLKVCYDQTKYFQSLLPLLLNLFKKLVAVLPSSSIYSLVNGNDTSIATLDITLNSGSLIACLVLDKLLVSRNTTNEAILVKLWGSVFSFQDSINSNEGLTIDILFQITKTIGIYLKNCNLGATSNNHLFEKQSDGLATILTTILDMKDRKENGVESVLNNGKFIAGMILNLTKTEATLTEDESNLKKIATKFF